MWRHINDPDLVNAYRREFLTPCDPRVTALLENLAQCRGENLYAATTMQHLRLTRAPDFSCEDMHDSVSINPRVDGLLLVHVAVGSQSGTSLGPFDSVEEATATVRRLFGIADRGRSASDS